MEAKRWRPLRSTGRVRRAGRNALRRAGWVARGGPGRPMTVVRAHYFDSEPNFGDELTDVILSRHGIAPVLTEPQDADLFGVGSIIDVIPAGFGGTVWGSGLIDDRRVTLPDATFLAVRGGLTLERVGSPPVHALGDPGLLAATLFGRGGRRWTVGLIPHYQHADDPRWVELARRWRGARLIDVAAPAAAVIRAIGACDLVVSSSLHGVIVADSYGIPAVRVISDPELKGGSFKFDDHDSVAAPGADRSVPLGGLSTLADARAAAGVADARAVAASVTGLQATIGMIRTATAHRDSPAWRAALGG